MHVALLVPLTQLLWVPRWGRASGAPGPVEPVDETGSPRQAPQGNEFYYPSPRCAHSCGLTLPGRVKQ
eukprot:8260499-Pyramimonas_sp.AAC.1